MIDWKLHFIFGLLFSITILSILYLVNFQLSVIDIIIVVSLSSFASLFPDVDMPKSKIRNVVSLAAASAIAILYLVNYLETWYYSPVYFILLYFILKYIPTKHRGVAHTFGFSILFSAIISVVFYFVLGSSIERLILYFAVSILGYNLHLILDKT